MAAGNVLLILKTSRLSPERLRQFSAWAWENFKEAKVHLQLRDGDTWSTEGAVRTRSQRLNKTSGGQTNRHLRQRGDVHARCSSDKWDGQKPPPEANLGSMSCVETSRCDCDVEQFWPERRTGKQGAISWLFLQNKSIRNTWLDIFCCIFKREQGCLWTA